MVKPSVETVSRTVDVAKVSSISAVFPMVVHYEQGRLCPARIEGSKNVMDELKVKSEGGCLRLEIPNGDRFAYSSPEEMVNVYVSAPGVADFESIAGAIIRIPEMNAQSLRLSTIAGGRIYADSVLASVACIEAVSNSSIEVRYLKSDALEVSAHSDSKVSVGGEARTTSVESICSAVDLSGLVSENTDVNKL